MIKTGLEILLLILLVIIIGIFIGLKFLPSDNTFNQVVRPIFLHSPVLKQVLGLNQASDNRFQYLGSQTSEILVQVSYSQNTQLNPQLESWITDMINQTTGKNTTIDRLPTSYIPSGPLSSPEIQTLIDTIETSKPNADQVFLHIIYADSSQELPTNSGWVLSDDTLIIFHTRIQELADNQRIQDQIEASTLKHEWGHLLGLPHLDQIGCIMSDTVEVYPDKQYQINNIPQQYCDESLARLAVSAD